MLQEQYITFDTAKLLKRANFNVRCGGCYDENGIPFNRFENPDYVNAKTLSAPSKALAMMWLREEYHIAVTPIPYRYPGKWKNILVYLGPPMEGDDKYDICQLDKTYDSYEDAAEGGIQHVVKNIVMKVIRERKKMTKEAKP